MKFLQGLALLRIHRTVSAALAEKHTADTVKSATERRKYPGMAFLQSTFRGGYRPSADYIVTRKYQERRRQDVR